LKPVKRREFIDKLKKLGFQGPFAGSKHQFMIFKNHRLTIPSNKEYSVPQLKFMLKEVERIIGKNISEKRWEEL
jgi:predicted RNA binding protein YcfA (HicA-like mRNA interferase family)